MLKINVIFNFHIFIIFLFLFFGKSFVRISFKMSVQINTFYNSQLVLYFILPLSFFYRCQTEAVRKTNANVFLSAKPRDLHPLEGSYTSLFKQLIFVGFLPLLQDALVNHRYIQGWIYFYKYFCYFSVSLYIVIKALFKQIYFI